MSGNNTIQIKRHLAGQPLNIATLGLYAGEMVFDCVTQKLYIGNGDDGTGRATSVTAIGGNGTFITQGQIGAVGGIPQLDSNGHIPSAYLANLFTGLTYKGVWDANANSPRLASGSGTAGNFYKVSVAGTTNLDGTNNWTVNDTLLFDGTQWARIGSGQAQGQNTGITSINGYTSATVTLKASDLSDVAAAARTFLAATSLLSQRSILGIDCATSVNDVAYNLVGGVDYSVALINITAPRVWNLPAANTWNPGTLIRIVDRSGNVSATNTLTLNLLGTGNKISGASSLTMSQSFGAILLECDGVSKYTIVSQPFTQSTPATIDGGVI